MTGSGQDKTIGDYSISSTRKIPNTSGGIFEATHNRTKMKFAARRVDRDLFKRWE